MDRVLFAGGGTGGHVYMAIAMAEELRARYPDIEILFVGTEAGLENRILPRMEYHLETIRIAGLKKVGILKSIKTLLQIPGSLLASWKMIHRFQPSSVVGVGGYSSGPLVIIAALAKIPSLLVEPNAYPGLTNRILSRWVDGAAVSFRETANWFGKKARVTGIPVRAEFHRLCSTIGESAPLRLLIFGGSQGSRPINRLFCEAISEIPWDRFQIVHQTGQADFKEVSGAYAALGKPAEIIAYIDDMPAQFERSDLILSRAGASTLAETTAAGKPSVLIPFPHAADNHQLRNAEAMASRGAAVVLHQEKTAPSDLVSTLLQLERDRGRLRQMARAAKSLAKPRSTAEIIDFLEELTQRRVQ